jgi:hypothetical protein
MSAEEVAPEPAQVVMPGPAQEVVPEPAQEVVVPEPAQEVVPESLPEPVPDVLLDVPDQLVYWLPTAAALPRLVVTLVRSVLRLLKMLMVLPTTGAVRAVPDVLVWLNIELSVLTRLAH